MPLGPYAPHSRGGYVVRNRGTQRSMQRIMTADLDLTAWLWLAALALACGEPPLLADREIMQAVEIWMRLVPARATA